MREGLLMPAFETDLAFEGNFTSTPQLKTGGGQSYTRFLLQDARFSSERVTDLPGFLRLRVTEADGDVVDVDLGCDYRVLAPVTLEVGPVLALEDAVGNKVAALFSRGEPRDFLDVDAIRRTGHFADGQLLKLAAARDGGFTVDWFAKRLASITRIAPERIRDRHQVDVDEFRATQARLVAWATTLAQRPRDIHDSGAASPNMQDRGPLGPQLT
ncbi:hypothetical protein C5E06_13350 [Pseudoclavibacter sp. RFBI5]|uniref:nucleotidyl transferase AbiEii/AbiGii toxin family protein n=1 Tax=Pseudoclavibacter sp. RFBI5 TaxID=2080578 RepID=UPI000CE839D1|nr:nucleotidyl transferase AbiEii/AbiGii toxin family protein [Pseudoclavibacter sp. RFBI5]PPG03370.1 hypothetical protein C5E06_13350 [Pseudoclavibacter sp. RFBI5]